jgi:hypothetical protein
MGVVTFQHAQGDISGAIIHIGLVIDAGDLGNSGACIAQKQKYEEVRSSYAGDPGSRCLFEKILEFSSQYFELLFIQVINILPGLVESRGTVIGFYCIVIHSINMTEFLKVSLKIGKFKKIASDNIINNLLCQIAGDPPMRNCRRSSRRAASCPEYRNPSVCCSTWSG